MANYNFTTEFFPFTFSDFPEDVQICILSFLPPSDIASLACTSKNYKKLCHISNTGLWHAICDRRWGPMTDIRKWGDGKTDYVSLYKTLYEYENLIGFWRVSGCGGRESLFGDAPLVFFEWGLSSVVGSRVTPCNDGTYSVTKCPLIWLELGTDGQLVSWMKGDWFGDEAARVSVSVSFMGKTHVVVEESDQCNYSNSSSPKRGSKKKGNEVIVGSPDSDMGSPPDRMMYEMYQHFANRTSPGASGERAWRRQRRRERERQARRKWEPQHLVKIVNCSPTPSRPLQGLWKGICDTTSLDFYLVAYDDIGGVSCRRVGDSKPFSGYAPVFWTSNATFIDSPLSHEEDYLYHTRMHLHPTDVEEDDFIEHSPSRLMYINSSYELLIPELAGTPSNPRHVEGRVWQYDDGTFGFGYLRDNFIVDLKHIAQNGRVLDVAEPCSG